MPERLLRRFDLGSWISTVVNLLYLSWTVGTVEIYHYRESVASMPLGPGVDACLTRLVQSLQDRALVVELGSHEGYSARLIADIILPKGGRLLCIDPYQGECPIYEGNRRIDSLNGFMGQFRPNEGVILAVGFSTDVVSLVRDGLFDMVFVDADHRYSRASLDIADWWPKVKPGGIMCGDDYEGADWDETLIEIDMAVSSEHGLKHHGLSKAVVERFGDKLGNDGSRCWYVRKGMDGLRSEKIDGPS